MIKNFGTLTVSNEENKDLFRIHIYENSLKFDKKMALGIQEHKELVLEINKLIDLWKQEKLSVGDLLKEIIILIEKNNDKVKDFYFTDEELNDFGKYVDLVPIDSKKSELQESEEATSYYKYLLKESVLKKINKKSFEKDLKEEFYVDCYLNLYKEIKIGKPIYYQYKLKKDFDFKTCNFIVLSGKVIFGYIF